MFDIISDRQYYLEQMKTADFSEEELIGNDSRSKANWMLRQLKKYGWIE